MSATTTNGRPPRRQLADEIDRMDRQMGDRLDRLDSIIDALAEGLPGAVTDACREGAREAVRTALVEVLSNPDLRTLLVPPAAAAGPRKPGLWGRNLSRGGGRDEQRPQFGVREHLDEGGADGLAGALAAGVGDRARQALGEGVDDRIEAVEAVAHLPVDPVDLVGQLLTRLAVGRRCRGHGVSPRGRVRVE